MDYTVTLIAWIPGDASLKINGTCTKTDPANGKCFYTPSASDVDTQGNYRALLELQKIGELLKTKPFTIEIGEGSPT